MSENIIKQFVEKRFLSNDPYETGSVSAWAIVSSYRDEDEKPPFGRSTDLSAELVIKDCYKTVTLDFYADGEEKQAQRLSKLDILIQTLQEFRQALPDVYDEYNKQKEIQKSFNKGVDTEDKKN
jgi:hypothetical protein